MGSMKMLSVSASETTEYLREQGTGETTPGGVCLGGVPSARETWV